MSADDVPKWWGTNPSAEMDRLTTIVHHALFVEDEARGPMFRWSTDTHLFSDDDPLLQAAACQVAFALLDRRDEVAGLLAAIAGSDDDVPRCPGCSSPLCPDCGR